MPKKKSSTKKVPPKSGESLPRFAGVTIGEPKENPLFTEFQHAVTRFMTYDKPVACAHCGKKRKRHWTQLVFFHVMEMAVFTLIKSDNEYPPLTPVCDDHILSPSDQNDLPTDRKPEKRVRKPRGG